MAHFDIRTALFFLGVGNVVFAVLIYFYARSSASQRIVSPYTLGRLLQGLGFLLILLRGQMPDLATKNLGNTLLLCGFGLECLAGLLLSNRTRLWPLLLLLLAGAVTAFNLTALTGGSPANLVMVASFGVAVLVALNGVVFIFPTGHGSPLLLWIGVADLIIAAANLARGLTALALAEFSLFTPDAIQDLTFGALYLFMLTNGFGFLLLTREEDERAMERLASIDSLTGVSNRRHFLLRAEEEFRRSRRHGLPLAFLMLDLDRFKDVNDRYGHAVGDEVLRAAAQRMGAVLRSEDLLGRVGGEEFAVLLLHTDPDGAMLAAERLRQGVAELRVAAREGEVRITTSIGVAQLAAGDATIEDTMRRADAALYAAKKAGRDCACS